MREVLAKIKEYDFQDWRSYCMLRSIHVRYNHGNMSQHRFRWKGFNGRAWHRDIMAQMHRIHSIESSMRKEYSVMDYPSVCGHNRRKKYRSYNGDL